MRIEIELYYETEWIARGQGIYVTASSLLELKDRLNSCLLEKSFSPPYEIKVNLDPDRVPEWLITHLDLKQEMIWKL
jgi:hypothetical protein